MITGMILFLVIMISNPVFSEVNPDKWKKMSDIEKLKLVNDLLSISDEMKDQIQKYKINTETLLSRIESLKSQIRDEKPKIGGFSIGAKGGFSLMDNKFYPAAGILSQGHIIFLNRIILSPGIEFEWWENINIRANISIGFLF